MRDASFFAMALLTVVWSLSGPFAPSAACGAEQIATPAATAIVPRASMSTVVRARELDAYARRAATLRRQAVAAGHLDYLDVEQAAYPAGVITDDVLAAKARWRAMVAARSGFTFLADYSLSNEITHVRPLVAVGDPALQSTLVAQYEATQHVIGIAPGASDFSVFHEAGHSLQRAALSARGTWQGRRAASHAPADRLEEALHAGRADDVSVQRLRYLASQDEFEVRLQDLNRFFATCVAGRPILSPSDSVRALAALGVPLETKEVSAVFAAAGQAVSGDEIDRLVAVAPITATESAQAFEDAHELCLLRRLILRVDPTYWPHVLAKIIFEAPGHL